MRAHVGSTRAMRQIGSLRIAVEKPSLRYEYLEIPSKNTLDTTRDLRGYHEATSLKELRFMKFKKPSGFPQKPLDLSSEYQHAHLDRRSFLNDARRFVVSGLTAGAVLEMMRPDYAWAQAGKETHPASARVLDQLRTRFTFQISVDVL